MPLIDTVSTKTAAPACADDIAENAGPLPDGGKKFGELMDRTLAKADHKPCGRQTQTVRKSLKKNEGAQAPEVADDSTGTAPVAKDDTATRQRAADQQPVPLIIVPSFQFFPFTVPVMQSTGALDTAGEAGLTAEESNGSTTGQPVALPATSAKSLFDVPDVEGNALTAVDLAASSADENISGTPTDTTADNETSATSGKGGGEKVDPRLTAGAGQLNPTTDGTILTAKEMAVEMVQATTQEQEASDTTQLEEGSTIPVSPSAEVATSTGVKTQGGVKKAENPNKTGVSEQENSTGISAAKQDVQMKKSDKKNNFAGSEKVLPENGVVALFEDNLPGRDRSSVIIPLPVERAESSSFSIIPSTRQPEVVSAPVETISLASAVIDIRARAIERTADIMALQSTRVNDMSGETLKITIRPGAGLELSVELRHGEQGIEASATLRNGDYHFLNSNWPDLQQRMEARGVRLSGLTCSDQFSNGNTNQFQQPQRQARQQEDPAYAGAFADFVMAGSIAKQTARSSAPRGWESWA